MSRRALPAPAGGFRRIAVLRLSSLGDCVLTLPVVHALHAAYPDARIDYWIKQEYADVVRFDPAIAHVRVLEPDARRLEDLVSMGSELEERDLIVDLHGNSRTRVLTFRQKAPVLRVRSERLLRERWVRARWTRPRPVPHALERYAATVAPLGIAVTRTPRVSAGPDAEQWAAAALAPGAPPVALCPGARHATKRWPEEHWVALHGALVATGVPVIALSTEAERRQAPALAAAVDAAGGRWFREPLARAAAVLSRCAVAVSGDSGLMHLAAAREVRVVALFGSTAPELGFAPAGEGHAVLCRHEPCQPCTLHGLERCPRGHFRCMRELLPALVETEVRRRLAPAAVPIAPQAPADPRA